MKSWIKIALSVVLSFMCLFTCIGYASTNSELAIVGEAQAVPPPIIFITGIRDVQTSNATVQTTPYDLGRPSKKVSAKVTFGGRNAYVSFIVTLKNNTEIDQYFDVLKEYTAIEGVSESFSSANVTASVTLPDSGKTAQGALLRAGESMDFKVTLTLNVRETNVVRNMLYEFDFVLDSKDLTQIVSKGITDKFAEILNGELEQPVSYMFEGTKYTVNPEEAYSKIREKMETSSPSGNYIGNLAGADEDDKALLTALFEGALTFKIGDEEVPITIMIKEKQLYNGGDKELVLFITGDDLSESRAYVPVYTAVFTKASDGVWEQIGQIHAGTARVIAYDGLESLLGIGTGSFNTETWTSEEAYYNGAAPKGSDIEKVMDAFEAQNKN